jgi:integrase
LTLGTAADGWSHTTARIELQNTLADVRRGIWSPVKPQPKRLPDIDPRFRDFATNRLRMSQPEWEPKTVSDYEWQLVHHLLPFFGDHRLGDITIAEVDRYKQTKASEARTLQAAIAEGKVLVTEYIDKNGQKRARRVRPLSPTSINKTIGRLSQILGVAVEYGLIQSNSAKGRRRRAKAHPIRPVWLDSAEHIEAPLDAAGELDHPAELKRGNGQRGGLVYRRALLATLIFAGPRIGDLTALNWRDIDLTA